MQYDLNMAPNASQRLEVSGRFFKYTGGTGKIRVTTNKGAVIDLTVGQGVWGEEFSSLVVQDRSGAANVGTLLAGNYDFRDDTVAISGSISVGNDSAHRVPVTLDSLQAAGTTIVVGNVWTDTSAVDAVNGIQVITAAQNVNGVVINKIECDRHATYGQNIYMKNGAGDTKTIRYMPPAGNYGDLSHLDVTQYVIPAGYAVWWRCTIAAWNGTRLMNYTLR